MIRHRSREELELGLDDIADAPKDRGVLEAIVIRPAQNERRPVNSVELSPEEGVKGDHWAKGCWMSLPDGSPHPDVQICIMNARVIRLLAGDKANWPPAGDQLFIDLDLSRANLSPGQRLSLGSTTLEITEVPHNGCQKFIERYGRDATQFVNSRFGKENRFRGIYAKVVEAGTISVGDVVEKI
ncbi:MAG: MOSC domain-containing protein [Geminicoccaceae bacterium]